MKSGSITKRNTQRHLTKNSWAAIIFAGLVLVRVASADTVVVSKYRKEFVIAAHKENAA